MSHLRVSPNLEVLRWAVSRSPADPRPASKNLDKWLRGEEKPTLRQLEQLAKKTAVPFGYFFLRKPPEELLPIPYFRTQTSLTEYSLNLLETVQTLQQRQT